MTENGTKPLTALEEKIVDAAIQTFVRYGPRKTSMADIAAAAGVSRQTLYDSFDGKDGLIRASIRTMTDRSLARVRERLAKSETLAERLDIYFAGTVVMSFELLQTAGDAEDLISGHNAAGREEIARSHERHEALIAELLEPFEAHLRRAGLSVRQQAHFVVTVAMGLKYSTTTREDLDDLLGSLKANCLKVTGG